MHIRQRKEPASFSNPDVILIRGTIFPVDIHAGDIHDGKKKGSDKTRTGKSPSINNRGNDAESPDVYMLG